MLAYLLFIYFDFFQDDGLHGQQRDLQCDLPRSDISSIQFFSDL